MNPNSRSEAVKLAEGIVNLTKGVSNADVVLFPPAPFLSAVSDTIANTSIQVIISEVYFCSNFM